MKVSVVIPLYNKAAYIDRALASVAAQTFTDYEIIVVDDGSTDDGGTIVAAMSNPRIRLICQPNAGPGAARNRGLREAAGPYVAFLDADDTWRPEFLDRSVALLEASGSEVASVSSGYFEYPSGRSTEPMWRRRRLADGIHHMKPSSPTLWAVHLLAYVTMLSTVARTEVLRRHGGFFHEGRCLYGEDSFLFLKVLLNEPVCVNLEPLACYHREASALSLGTRAPRPVEPILTHASEIERACPPELHGLLGEILAIRAMKTACMLGYWGRQSEAAAMVRRFAPGASRRPPRYWAARLLASPMGPPLGAAWRILAGRD